MNEQNIDDIFMIPVFGYDKVKKWKFPYVKCCPVKDCGKAFFAREFVIQHYREIHAENTLWCSVCDRGIGTNKTKQLLKHYRKKHPDAALPENWQKYLVDNFIIIVSMLL